MKTLIIPIILLVVTVIGVRGSEQVRTRCSARILFDTHGAHSAVGNNRPEAMANALKACRAVHLLGCLPVPLSCKND